MKLKNKILMIILFLGILFVFSNVSYAGTQKLNSLDYQAKLNSDGSMDVVETWNIYIKKTNTLFKTFELDSDKYSGITDAKVKNLNTGEELTQINEPLYHVTKDCYYALPISSSEFEIAWGVGLDDSSETRTYEISYTVEDAVTVYNDCSELYWMFVGTDNGIPAKKVTGTIKLPQKISDIEKLRVWAHGPLHGKIEKESEDTVIFSIKNFDSKTMLETRVVVEDKMFNQSSKIISENKLQEILEEEEKWADEANKERGEAILNFIARIIIIAIVYALLTLLFLPKIKKYKNQLNNMPDKRNIDIGEYFRDIPREKESTPAEAAYLYYSEYNDFTIFNNNKSKVFSATLLQLCLKGMISFEDTDKKDIKINILTKDEKDILKPTETVVYNLLKSIKGSSSDTSLQLSEMKEYAKKNYDEFSKVMTDLEIKAKDAHVSLGNFSEEELKKVIKVNAKVVAYGLGIFFIVGLGLGLIMLPLVIEFIICIILLRKISKKMNVLTEQGETEKQQWKGLKKYMEDFSMLDQREIPDLVLWEKYLVYATAFGISDKVIKQLKIVYPNIEDINDSDYGYIYLMSSSHFGSNFIEDFNSGIEKVYSTYESAYNAAHLSSSSGGGGGGFSSGGGGRRWRRPEWEEDKFLKKWRKNYENWNRYRWKSYWNRFGTFSRDYIKQRKKF